MEGEGNVLRVDALRHRCRIATGTDEFVLSPEHTNQLRGVRLLLRLLFSIRDRDGDPTMYHPDGPVLTHANVQIPTQGRILAEILGIEDEPQIGGLVTEATRALRRILNSLDGWDHVLPADTTRRSYMLELGELAVEADLLEVSRDAWNTIEATRCGIPGTLEDLVGIESQMRGAFSSPAEVVVHEHLEPFAAAVAHLHTDLLRSIIAAAARAPADPDARVHAGRAGRVLARHGRDAFDVEAQRQFLRTATDNGSDLSSRRRLLRHLAGEAAAGPEAVAPEPHTSVTPFGPDELRTGRVVSVRTANPVLIGLDDGRGGRGLCAYVRRSVHDRVVELLKEALTQPGPTVICLDGPRLSGKTRLAYEAMRETCPDAWLIAPTTAPHAARVYDPEAHPALYGTTQPVVLWLDDLERYLADGERRGLTAGHIEALWDHPCPPLVVLCTRGGRAHDRLLEHPAVADELARLLNSTGAQSIGVELRLDPTERQRAAADVGPNLLPEIDRVGLGPALAGRPLLRQRFRDGIAPGDAPQSTVGAEDGQAFIDALLGWRAAVGPGVAEDAFVYQAWVRTRTSRGRRDRPDDAAWARATHWATAAVASGFALAEWDDEVGGWRVDPSVEELSRGERAALAHRLFGNVIRRWAGADPERLQRVADNLQADKQMEGSA